MKNPIKKRDVVSWGVTPLDQSTGGIPAKALSVVETPDHHSGMILLGQYLMQGLERGERVALVSFDSPTTFLENFLSWNLDFSKYIESEHFIFLNYSPDVGHELGMVHDYDALMLELKRLCKGEWPKRVAFHQIDALINLNSPFLMNSCAQKLTLSVADGGSAETTVLGQLVQFGDQVHRDLAIALQKVAAGYFELCPQATASHYVMTTKKLPWFGYKTGAQPLNLVEGEGFVPEGQYVRATKSAS